MFFDKANVHRLLVVAGEKSKNFQRSISCFRTADGTAIDLFIYLQEENPSILVKIERGSHLGDLQVEENYRLYADGSCSTYVVAYVKSVTGFARHRTENIKKYTMEQTLARYPHDGWKWLCNQLDVLVDWLSDKSTVRVDPYHPEKVLGDEETEADRTLAANIAMVEDFRKKLHNTPLTPDIHVIE